MFLAIAICLATLHYQAMVVTGRVLDLESFLGGQVTKMIVDPGDIDPYCHGVCADLLFYDENDVLLHVVHGTDARIMDGKGVKGVAKVKTVGHYGSTLLYPRLSPPLLIGG